MRRKLRDSELLQVLSALGYPSKTAEWAVEVLQGRIDLGDLFQIQLEQISKAYSVEPRLVASGLTSDQIDEAASYAAMEQLRREIRDPHEPPDSSGFWVDEDPKNVTASTITSKTMQPLKRYLEKNIEVRRRDEREGA